MSNVEAEVLGIVGETENQSVRMLTLYGYSRDRVELIQTLDQVSYSVLRRAMKTESRYAHILDRSTSLVAEILSTRGSCVLNSIIIRTIILQRSASMW